MRSLSETQSVYKHKTCTSTQSVAVSMENDSTAQENPEIKTLIHLSNEESSECQASFL